MIFEVDADGFFLGDALVEAPGRLYIQERPPSGMFLPRWIGGEWVEGGVLEISPAMIASRRYEAEVGGTVLNGMQIGTDDRSKLLINGAALDAAIDPARGMQWKVGDAFVQLTGAQVIDIARAVRAHVQACFDREAELLAALADGTLTGDMLAQGWPV